MSERLIADGWIVDGWSRGKELPKSQWDLLLCCIGTLLPVGPFFDGSMEDWNDGLYANAVLPLELLHKLYRQRSNNALVVFFAGPNPNRPQPGYSAYDVAKIVLIRMVENLNSESPDLRFVAIGPGFMRSKMTAHIPPRVETNPDDLYELLKVCLKSTKQQLGRNVHIRDSWRSGLQWTEPSDCLKLRRMG